MNSSDITLNRINRHLHEASKNVALEAAKLSDPIVTCDITRTDATVNVSVAEMRRMGVFEIQMWDNLKEESETYEATDDVWTDDEGIPATDEQVSERINQPLFNDERHWDFLKDGDNGDGMLELDAAINLALSHVGAGDPHYRVNFTA